MILPDMKLLILSFWAGAALSVCAAFYESVRVLMRLHSFTVFLLDILFCVLCGAVTFLLALVCSNGFLRLYWFIFEAAGFFCVHITIGFLLRRCTEKLCFFFKQMQAKRKRKKGKRKENSAGIPSFFRKRREKIEKKT